MSVYIIVQVIETSIIQIFEHFLYRSKFFSTFMFTFLTTLYLRNIKKEIIYSKNQYYFSSVLKYYVLKDNRGYLHVIIL